MNESNEARFQRPHYLIDTFTRHPLAANLLMIILILAGVWGTRALVVHLNPHDEPRSASVVITWPGATAEDIERLITQPVEYQLRAIRRLQSLTSNTVDGFTSISVDFESGTDMGDALDRVKQQVAQTRDLPPDMEPPVITRSERLETIAAILLSGGGSLAELVPIARQIERDLMARGADVIQFRGIPQEEIAIQIDSKTLFELGVPLHKIALKIIENSIDVPAGSVGSGQLERRLRSLDQRRSSDSFAQLPIETADGDQLQYLGDIATIERRQKDDQRLFYYDGEPAIMLTVRLAQGSDTMKEAQILHDWQAANADSLALQGVKTTIWLEAWRFARDTIMLVFNNGISGLCLVVATLFLFLNGRVATWVTVGIPVSFLGAFAVFYFLGGSINIISMIGVVMALGIVVDDAIVVGEHALYQFEQGKSPEVAAALGAHRMFTPVVASSLTTMAAFLPLIVLDDAFIREIPLLMICVIAASLIECFLILPGHLRHSFQHMQNRSPGALRRAFDTTFARFRDSWFIPNLKLALENRRVVLVFALSAFVVSMSLLVSGRVKPDLNLNVDFEFADVYIQFAAGASEQDKEAYLQHLEQAVFATNEEFGGDVVVTHVWQRNWAYLEQQARSGSQYAAMWVELVSPDQRDVTLAEFSAAWQARLAPSAYVETLQFESGEDEWPDLQLYFSGADVITLKAAAEDLAHKLASYPGITNVFDDLPYGKEQWIFSLTTGGRAAGLTSAEIGRQLAAAFEGYRVQLFTENDTELEVRLSLPASERNQLATIGQLPITTPSGAVMPLTSVADIGARRGIERINHRAGQKVINVYGSVDNKISTPMAVITALEEDVIPDITQRYGVTYGLGERSAHEAELLEDMLLGAVIGLALIYLILAWIFASWSWPLAVMAAIPLGLTGAIAGLQFMDLNLGALAIMGLFTLTGVIVNDSIILITTYKENREAGDDSSEALLGACHKRLRPVILTSLTTTLGLAPLMLESSPMGETMAPLAVVICFGLLYGTTLILVVIPAILSILESLADRFGKASKKPLIHPSTDSKSALDSAPGTGYVHNH
ncbi:MAG: efflux RND transporter permease subunit [Halieaceae bacterium]|jgi:multidrug efflux pump subunit AcrB|nr:efflux RND transporter permease subunit [Halieaceae bacterium]